MICVVCKQEIKEDQQWVMESEQAVHSGVCHDYLRQQSLDESFDSSDVQLLVD